MLLVGEIEMRIEDFHEGACSAAAETASTTSTSDTCARFTLQAEQKDFRAAVEAEIFAMAESLVVSGPGTWEVRIDGGMPGMQGLPTAAKNFRQSMTDRLGPIVFGQSLTAAVAGVPVLLLKQMLEVPTECAVTVDNHVLEIIWARVGLSPQEQGLQRRAALYSDLRVGEMIEQTKSIWTPLLLTQIQRQHDAREVKNTFAKIHDSLKGINERLKGVEDRQDSMEQRQQGLEGEVRWIQNHLCELVACGWNPLFPAAPYTPRPANHGGAIPRTSPHEFLTSPTKAARR